MSDGCRSNSGAAAVFSLFRCGARWTMKKLFPFVTLSLLVLGPVGCDALVGGEVRGGGRAEVPPDPQPVHIDSTFPIEEEVRRFRAGLDPVETLEDGASSREALVERFLAALEAEDVDALRALAINPAEFAYLYYPHTHYTRRPYEMGPALVWFQLENYGGRGLSRALSRYGGRELGAVAHECAGEAAEEGPNLVWSECVVQLAEGDGNIAEVSLFGAILERDGRFKFVSYGNRL